MSDYQEEMWKITEARHHDPFSFLGKHRINNQWLVRSFLPRAQSASLAGSDVPMQAMGESRIFQWQGERLDDHYEIIWWDGEKQHKEIDPYSFGPQIADEDLYYFGQGRHWRAQHFLGANVHRAGDIEGILFAVWAPNAERVSVVGDFNDWDGRRHCMRVRGDSGVWELFIPASTTMPINHGSIYKFEIRDRQGHVFLKADPYAKAAELRPKTASLVQTKEPYAWQDQAWMQKRRTTNWQHGEISVYEVHLGSWRKNADDTFLSYRQLARQLVAYVQKMGFTHIELLPIAEYPYDPSWGYQGTGYFAPTARYGHADDLRFFVDLCHQNGIGVFLDWVPAHFPTDNHSLARFDGSALYEHADPRQGLHLDWNTLIFNYGRNEVRSFLFSSALYWLESFHFDGLRVDAVASMLYLDYSKTDWVPNQFGGRENLEAISFLKELNAIVHDQEPGVLMMAEESTAWPQVTQPTDWGGLGFDFKWNMGWMNDTLSYISLDPVHRKYHHNILTFSMLYAFSEKFILPFSHDEVVHGKQSMLNKMPGDEWQKFANVRLLYTYMFTHPGKKLLFQGCEFAQGLEWQAHQSLDWYVLDYPFHQGVQNLVRDLNHLLRKHPALYRHDGDWQGFEWIDCHDGEQSLLSFLRRSEQQTLVVVCNFTPVPRTNYRLGVPYQGLYREIFNSDASLYAGGNIGNGHFVPGTEDIPWMDRPCSITINVPPLGAVVFEHRYD